MKDIDNGINKGIGRQKTKARSIVDIDLTQIECDIEHIREDQQELKQILMQLIDLFSKNTAGTVAISESMARLTETITKTNEINVEFYPGILKELVASRMAMEFLSENKAHELALLTKKENRKKDSQRKSESYTGILDFFERSKKNFITTHDIGTKFGVTAMTALKVMRLVAYDYPTEYKFVKSAGNNPAFLSKRRDKNDDVDSKIVLGAVSINVKTRNSLV